MEGLNRFSTAQQSAEAIGMGRAEHEQASLGNWRFEERIKRLNWLQRSWTNYFKLAFIQAKLKKVDT